MIELPPPTLSVIVIDEKGKRVGDHCSHPLVPGLDAQFCRQCRTWYSDEQMGDRVWPERVRLRKADAAAEQKARRSARNTPALGKR